ncbi:nuclear transport factor 2 family protein [Nocardia arthritidis]|uniref:nuclear transport factor 2 family protein n=1 Tax=Nocardia arthritidis TaxID=228602 RepID=UPI0007A46E25|nr:nuclear transport factor 2 family protein [Nocardia arthritidis]
MRKIRSALPLLALPLAALTAACASATATPTPEVREMLDRRQIAALVDRLGRALDEGRFEELRAIYTQDATAKTPGGTAEGREALIAQASRNHSDGKRIQHVISNVLIDLRGDAADVRANLIATFALAPSDGTIPQPQYTLGEVYRFDAVRTADGWRLTRVQTTPVWSTGTLP